MLLRQYAVRLAARIAVAASLSVAANAAVIYVNVAAPGGTHDGASWATAYTDLQLAIGAAAPTDEIWVAKGTYKPTTSTDRTATFTLKNNVAIYGGFAGTETSRTQRDWNLNPTILSGEIGAADATDNSYHVVTDNAGSSAFTSLDGFTIRGGQADGGSPFDVGGGMFISGGSSIVNCTITGNYAASAAGGIYVDSGVNPTFTDCLIRGNSTGNTGGGLFTSAGTFTRCRFDRNAGPPFFVFNGASGVGVNGGTVKFDQCRFTNHTSPHSAVVVQNSATVTFQACMFRANSWTSSPDAVVHITSGSTAFFVSSVFDDNSTPGAVLAADGSITKVVNADATNNASPFLCNNGGGTFTVANSIVWNNPGGVQCGGGNPITITFSDMQAADPHFLNGGDPADIHLTAQSTALVDSGDSTALPPGGPYTDIDGASRINGPSVDVGADEYTTAPSGFNLSVLETGAGAGTVVSNVGSINCGFVCSANYDLNTVVVLTATADAGSAFTRWTGACAGSDPCVLTMDAAKSVKAIFSPLRYVNGSAGGTNDGSTWANAYTDLANAMASAPPGSEIWVRAGTYTPGSDRNASFLLRNGVAIFGGFTGNETARDQRNYSRNETILSGEVNAPGYTDNTRHIIAFSENAPVAAILDGFTITGAYDDSFPGGAGLLLGSNADIRNCKIVNNRSQSDAGGGALVNNASAQVSFTNCVFANNSALRGAAIATSSAGYTGVSVNNCTIVGSAPFNPQGGAISAAGISVGNSIIWGNASPAIDPNNDCVIRYSIVQEAHAGPGNVTADPKFSSDAVLRPRASSPAIDAGSNALFPGSVPARDLSDVQRFVDDPLTADTGSGTAPLIDMGAYEYSPTAVIVSISGGGTGTVISVPSGINCGSVCAADFTAGATVTLVAAASGSSHFNGWGGDCTGVGTCVVTAPANVTARFGNVWYVRQGASGANNGTSWANAFTDLQNALAAAVAGDDIWVAAATYKPTSIGDRTVSFDLRSGVGVYGGFAGVETQRSQQDVVSNVTVLSGEINAPGAGDNSYHVVTATSVGSDTTLDGFTITAGFADGSGGGFSSSGGGIFLNGASAVISHCNITGNYAQAGGGVNAIGGNPSVRFSTISSNTANNGGGASIQAGSISDSRIAGNSDSNEAGGVIAQQSARLTRCVIENNGGTGGVELANSALLENSVVRGNSGSLYGGVRMPFGTPRIASSLITGNIANGGQGSGVTSFSAGTLVNVTIADNGGSPGVQVSTSGPTMLMTNCIVYSSSGATPITGTPAVTYSDIWPVAYAGTGNLNVDPQFGNNYHLLASSACIDAGDNSALDASMTLDVSGKPRRVNTVDMGADEYSGSTVSVTIAGVGAGTVTSSPSGINCGSTCYATFIAGAQVTLTATPSSGWHFNGWDGDCTGLGSCVVISPANVIARFGRLWFVNQIASGANNGTSWANAFTSLQSALAVAGTGDEIWVASGTYKPTTSTDRTATFTLPSGVGIYGGFAGNEGLRSQQNPALNVTTLSGEIGAAGTSDNSYHVVTSIGAASGTTLDGFTITAGNADNSIGPPSGSGGGIYLDTSAATVAHCIITANSAAGGGGNVYSIRGKPSFRFDTITNGSAPFSAGVYFGSGSGGSISDSRIAANTSTNQAAGISVQGTSRITRCVIENNSGQTAVLVAESAVAENSVIRGNTATFSSPVEINGSVARLVDSLVVANGSTGSPPALGVTLSSGATMVNDTVADNSSPGSLPQVNGFGTLKNCIVVGPGGAPTVAGSLTVTYSDIYPNGVGGTGNIGFDPQLTAVYHLKATSPCIDAGDNSAVDATMTADVSGKPRRVDVPTVVDTGAGTAPIVDMGADEYSLSSVTVSTTGSGSGTVTSSPAGISCGSTCVATFAAGAQVTLTATPAAGTSFNGWEGDCTGLGTCVVTSPANVVARFGHLVYVKQSAAGLNNGTSWANAFTSLQSALAAVAAGDDVWVAAATYKPTPSTDRTATFTLRNGVGIYGGFAGNETSRSQQNPALNVTILSGEIGAAGSSDNSYHVVTSIGAASGTTLDGFTITAGNADNSIGPPSGNGGGVYLDTSAATIAHCIITANSAPVGAGANVYSIRGKPSFSFDTITNGSAQIGSGVFFGFSSGGSISDSRIAANTSTGQAAGISAQGTSRITRCVIENNSGQTAVLVAEGAVGQNCVIRGNAATNSSPVEINGNPARLVDSLVVTNVVTGAPPASGVFVSNGATMVNDTVTDNSGPSNVAQVTGSGTVTNCIIAASNGPAINGSFSVTYSDIFPNGAGGVGDISFDPQLTAIYHLKATSPCIDAGDNSAVDATMTSDVSGKPRRVDIPTVADTGAGTAPIVDMGADEYSLSSVTVSTIGAGSGLVTSSPSGINCGSTCVATFAPGTPVTLTATPAAGTTFNGWEGDCSGLGTCIVNSPANVVARFGRTWFVKQSAPGSNNGTSWTNAFTSLQSALSVAVGGDEVWVAFGTYTPTATTDRTATFTVPSGVGVYGGFAGIESSRTQQNPIANPTLLSGEIGAAGPTDNSYHVVTFSGSASDTTLDGFTITGGNADNSIGPPSGSGGGVYFNATSATLSHSVVTSNAALQGGGVFSIGGKPSISFSTISNNTATNGGGILLLQTAASVSDSTISGNSDANQAGGLIAGGATRVIRCVIENNTSSGPNTAGGAWFQDSAVGANLIIRNNTGNYAGGLIVLSPNTARVTGSLITGNSDNTGPAAGVFVSGGSLVNDTIVGNTGNAAQVYGSGTITNCIVVAPLPPAPPAINGGFAVSFSDVSPSGYGGPGNIAADPQFIDAAHANYRINQSSPCVDAGDNSAVDTTLSVDLAGKPRRIDVPTVPDTGSGAAPVVDMGFDEVYPVTFSGLDTFNVCAGASHTFTSNATGYGALTYQWRKNQQPIGGANGPSYTVSNASATDDADYDIIVTDSLGMQVTSPEVHLQVSAGGPVIDTPPSSVNACDSATFTVSASGDYLKYQWRKGGNPITGATSATYQISPASAADAGSYDVVVSNACNSITSGPVTLTFSGITITQNPVSATFDVGATGHFTAAATSNPSSTIQWQRFNGTAFADVPGANTATLNLPVSIADNGAQFRAAFSNGSCPTVYSAVATLTVQQFTDPTITQNVTPVRQVHFQELRDRILQLRTQYGVTPAQYPYTNATLTNITAADLVEMRTALAQAYTAAARTPPSYTNAITQGISKVTKTDIDQLRTACVALE